MHTVTNKYLFIKPFNDVFSTGSMANECAKILQKVEAVTLVREVQVLLKRIAMFFGLD